MDFKQILIPFSDLLISDQESNYIVYNIYKSNFIENTSDQFIFPSPIRQAFETTHPDNF